MNLALGAIILYLLFIVPALFFFRFYYSGEFSKQYFKASAFELFLSSIIPGVLFQFIYYQIILVTTNYQLDFEVLGMLLLGGDEKEIPKAFSKLKDSLPQILEYNLSLWIILAWLGWISKFVVRKLRLDRSFVIFRFRNHWHYLLRGEILDFPNIEGRESDIELTYLNVVVNIGNAIYLYSGFLDHFQLTSEGSGLDYILLSNVERREITDVVPQNANSIVFAGDFFQIPYATIINMNIHYIRISDVDDSTGTESE